jgi:alpha-2-macroglobulin
LLPKIGVSEQASALRFTNDSGLNAYYVLEQSGFDRTPPTQPITQGLEVLREYTDAQGNALTRIKMGEQVDVHLKFRGLGAQDTPSIALVDLLPGGFELVVPQVAADTEFSEASTSEGETSDSDGSSYVGWQCHFCAKQTAELEYADLREDRVVFYTTASKDVKEIVYRIKATNVGSYVVAPAYGEAMYQRRTVARSAAGRIEVVRP